MRPVVAVCFDAGPANNVGPVIRCLHKMGVYPHVYAAGPAEDVLKNLDIEFRPYTNARELVSAHAQDDVLLYSAIDCNTTMPGAEIAAELEARDIHWLIHLQNDMWGGGLYKNYEWKNICPARFYANDPLDAKMAITAFPFIHPSDALITGWPWLDKYRDRSKIPALAQSLTARLEISGNMPIIFYAGQLQRTGEAFASLVRAIISLDKPVHLIARLHPAMLPSRDPDGKWLTEYHIHENAARDFQEWGKGRYSMCNGPDGYPLPEQIALADVVVGMFSTVLLEASAWRKQTIALLYPEVGLQEWREVTLGVMPEFPLTELKCASKADSDETLQRLLSMGYTGELEDQQRPNQETHFHCDGENAQRIASDIFDHLG